MEKRKRKKRATSRDITSKGRFCSRNSRSVKQILNADIFPELENSCLFFPLCFFWFFFFPLWELFKYTVSVLPFLCIFHMDGAVKCKVQTYTCISIWMEAWRLIKLHFVYNTVTCDLDGMWSWYDSNVSAGSRQWRPDRWHQVLENIRAQQNRKKKPLNPRQRSWPPWTASILFALTCFTDGCNRWAGKGQQPATCWITGSGWMLVSAGKGSRWSR